MDKQVHMLPVEQDQEIASIRLQTQGLAIDELTEEQKKYAVDHSAGT
jgi:S-adenosylhomocysteine hydrolase